MSEKKQKVYPKGIMFFKKHEKAPEFVKGTMVISINQLVEWVNNEGAKWLRDYKGEPQIKCQITEWEGKLNCEVDTYKKSEA